MIMYYQDAFWRLPEIEIKDSNEACQNLFFEIAWFSLIKKAIAWFG